MTDLSETNVDTRRIIYPRAANDIGTAHGGNLLMWMEQVSSWSAMRLAGTVPLTVGVVTVSFHRPIPQGDIVLLEAYVYETGDSSMQTRVRGYHEDKFSGERNLAVEGEFALVAVDESNEPVSVPDLTVSTELGERLLADAVDEA
ncbi:acyl-CoA thioesterase [Halobacteriales archaeon Cl-PHB]